MEKMNEVPRRHRMDQWTEAELAIYGAMQEVEKMGASLQLTDAVVLLGAAKDAVADHVEGIQNVRRVLATAASPEEGTTPNLKAVYDHFHDWRDRNLADLKKIGRNMTREAVACVRYENNVLEDVLNKLAPFLLPAAFSAQTETPPTWRPMETCDDGARVLMLTKHGAIEGVWDKREETGHAYFWQHIGAFYSQGWMPVPPKHQAVDMSQQICACGHVQLVHLSSGCMAVRPNAEGNGETCSCKSFQLRPPPRPKSAAGREPQETDE